MELASNFQFSTETETTCTAEPTIAEPTKQTAKNYDVPDRRGRIWTAAEDEMLLSLFQIEGGNKWTTITR
jgi:hypothetical protein